jgi:hypothetical protein
MSASTVASLGNMGQTSEIDRPQTAKDGSDVGPSMVESLGNMGQTSEIDRPQTAKDGAGVGKCWNIAAKIWGRHVRDGFRA